MKSVRELMSWLVPVAIGVLLAFLLIKFVVTSITVSGPSMEPNLTNKERIFALRQAKVKHGSVIIFDAYGEDPQAQKPGDNYVKRVIGLPGDTVSSKQGNLYVNGKKVSQSYISQSQRTKGTGDWDLKSLADDHSWSPAVNKVPAGKYFVLGDHRSVSNDSRYWGFVDQKKVLGVAKVPIWSGSSVTRHNINQLAY